MQEMPVKNSHILQFSKIFEVLLTVVVNMTYAPACLAFY